MIEPFKAVGVVSWSMMVLSVPTWVALRGNMNTRGFSKECFLEVKSPYQAPPRPQGMGSLSSTGINKHPFETPGRLSCLVRLGIGSFESLPSEFKFSSALKSSRKQRNTQICW